MVTITSYRKTISNKSSRVISLAYFLIGKDDVDEQFLEL